MKTNVKLLIFLVFLRCYRGERGHKNVEIIHKGTPIEDLAKADDHLDSHEIANIKELIQPKLINEEMNERQMLSQMGIDDMYPLDKSVESEKPLPKPIIATEEKSSSNDYMNDDLQSYNKGDFPEYNAETKADFSQNQEAADWLTKHPNTYNARNNDDEFFPSLGSTAGQTKTTPSYQDDNYENSEKSDWYSDSESGMNNGQSKKVDESSRDDKMTEQIFNDENSTPADNKGGKEKSTDTAHSSMKQNRKNQKTKNKKLNTKKKKYKSIKDVGDMIIAVKADKSTKAVKPIPNDFDGNPPRPQLTMKLDLMDPEDSTNNVKQGKNNQKAKPLKDSIKVAVGLPLNFVSNDEGAHKKASSKMPTVLKRIHSKSNSQKRISTKQELALSKLRAHVKGIAQVLPLLENANTQDTKEPEEEKSKAVKPDTKVTEHHEDIAVTSDAISQHGGQSREASAMYKLLEPEIDEFGQAQLKGDLPTVKPSQGKGVPGKNVQHTEDASSFMNKYKKANGNGFMSLKMLIGSQMNQMQKMIKNYQSLKLKQNAIKTDSGIVRNKTPLPDKTYSSWNEWSQCSVTCGTGAMARARVCRSLVCRKDEMYETRSCERDTCPDEWQKRCLEEHNKIRAKHHVQPLSWSQPLAERAQKLANMLAIKQSITPADLEEENGESVAQLWKSSNDGASKSTNLWYKEIKNYSFSYPELTPQNHHFVQMVWKETKELGMAKAKSPYGDYSFVVALYNPPGVNSRTLVKNVFRLKKGVDVYSTFRRQNIVNTIPKQPNRQQRP